VQFDPAQATGVFRLSTPDRLSLALVPLLFARLQQFAPNMSLQVITAEREQALDLLDGDRTDLALGWLDEKPSHLNAESVHEEKLFCVFRRGRPILKRGVKFDIRGGAFIPASGGKRDRPAHGDFRRPVGAPRLAASCARGGDEFHRRTAVKSSWCFISIPPSTLCRTKGCVHSDQKLESTCRHASRGAGPPNFQTSARD
jgi:DNA-binding transcriptional LysR family regulator